MPQESSIIIPLALALLWSLLALFTSTAVIAIGAVSRTKLIEALERYGRRRCLAEFDRYHREYTLTAQAYRLVILVLFVITVEAVFPAASPWAAKSAKVLLISTAWFLLVGVAVPTAWARYAGESFLAAILPALALLRRLSWPLLAVVEAIDEIVRRLAGAPREARDPAEALEQEILDAVSQAAVSGVVDPSEKAMIKSVMVLDETYAGEVMTPRTAIVGIDSNADFQQARALVADAAHSRMPVFEATIDHVVGILYAKDLLAVTDPAAFSLPRTMRKATFVPETKDLASLLREFQANRIHMAIVLDEYGGTAGLVTIEDILEELVGEIADEHDEVPLPPIRHVDAATAEVDACVRIEDANEELQTRLPEDESYDTVGGYVFSKLGRVPAAGESFVDDNVKVEVLQADERRISRVRLHVLDKVEG